MEDALDEGRSGKGVIARVQSFQYLIVAVVGTLSFATLIFHQWWLPAVTSSLTLRIERYENELGVANKRIADLEVELSAASYEADLTETRYNALRDAHEKSVSAHNAEVIDLKRELFKSRQANIFQIGSPYPVGFSSLRVSSNIEEISSELGDRFEEIGRSLILSPEDSPFSRISYIHSATEDDGIIDSIVFSLHLFGDQKIPATWLQDALVNALGQPYLIGRDEDCLLWKTSDELVYHIKGDPRFRISGFRTYPAGCDITDEQVERILERREAGEKE
jgi:hypothetical protein